MSSIKYFCVSIILTLNTWAQPCASLTNQEKSQLEAFVHAWYKLPNDQTITLVDASTVGSACYTKLSFRASAPAPLLTLYLTPDREHLVSALMDLAVDPIVTQRKRQKDLADKLGSGALLVSGEPLAQVKMVVFSDFQCPYCKKFAKVVDELTPEERAGLEIIYRQLPLKIHSWASDAAELSTCVALQNNEAFWKLHGFLFTQQEELTKETLENKSFEFLSHETALDRDKVTACLTSNAFRPSLQADAGLAQDLGITSTPSVFVNGRKVSIRSVEDLRAALRVARSEVIGAGHENELKQTSAGIRNSISPAP
jgi:protein-disulfide isomerase